MMRRSTVVCALLSLLVLVTPNADAGGVTAGEVFERLKSMAGTWKGHAEGTGEEAEASAKAAGEIVHEFRVSAAGTVVMEMMGPGSDHEMINMYHLDGDDLMLTHYCAGGNQPRMRLNRESSTANALVFDFDGGTNLDPDVDHHIHNARVTFEPSGDLLSAWVPYAAGKPAGEMVFHLSRAD